MQILFDPQSLFQLHEYGISIPMLDDRVHSIVKHLQNKEIEILQKSDDPNWPEASKDIIALAHDEAYVQQVFGSERQKESAIQTSFELVTETGQYHRYHPDTAKQPLNYLMDRALFHTAGTMKAVDVALNDGCAYFLGGGLHHAMTFGGRGFCALNDIVIAARWAQKHHRLKKVWIIDVDAHKGDGTAQITHDDSTLATLSIHMAKGWPLDQDPHDENGRLQPWFIPSDIDIPIEQGGEKHYLTQLEQGLAALEEKYGQPDLAIVVQGSDPCVVDALPSSSLLQLSLEQMLERDRMVYSFLSKRHIPQAYVMSGGYGDQAYRVYCQFFDDILG
jgi:acetoin utilization deacetylase AcuC-like enzyme